jgi:ribosomal-protein-serine acetyltransferase
MEVEIRPWREDDAPELAAAVAESLAELLPWMPWAANEPQTPHARAEYIRTRNQAELDGGDRVRAILVDGVVAGGAGLHRRIAADGFAIGYWVRTSLTGRGIATTVVSLLCAEAFSDPSITHVEIHHDIANTASGAVAAKSGFTVVRESGSQCIWRLTRAQHERP